MRTSNIMDLFTRLDLTARCVAARLCRSMQVLTPVACSEKNNELFQCQVSICLKDNKHGVDSDDCGHPSLQTLCFCCSGSNDPAVCFLRPPGETDTFRPAEMPPPRRACACTRVNNLWPFAFNKTAAAAAAAASEAEAIVCTVCLLWSLLPLHAPVLAASWQHRRATI